MGKSGKAVAADLIIRQGCLFFFPVIAFSCPLPAAVAHIVRTVLRPDYGTARQRTSSPSKTVLVKQTVCAQIHWLWIRQKDSPGLAATVGP